MLSGGGSSFVGVNFYFCFTRPQKGRQKPSVSVNIPMPMAVLDTLSNLPSSGVLV